MADFDPDSPAVELLRGAEGDDVPAARSLRRQAGDGRMRRVRAGYFTTVESWSAASALARFRARIDAVVASRREPPILTHFAAAAVWGIPILGRWPESVELHAAGGARRSSKNGVLWRTTPFDDGEIEHLDGVAVTGLAQTLLDVACASSFLSAVVSLDHGLRPRLDLPDGRRVPGAAKEDLAERLRAGGARRGSRSAAAAIAFADGASGSPGESLSRGQMRLLRFPPPRLQVPLPRGDGGNDVLDFDWPEHGVFGEFDGRAKYFRAEYTRGRTLTEIVWAEKERENRIRMHRPRGARWDWQVAWNRRALEERLRSAGLRPQEHP